MKVYNLSCVHSHRFEGWFSSEEDFHSQSARQLIECPVCGDRAIEKLPSAPRLNLSTAPADKAPEGARPDRLAQLQEQWQAVIRRIIADTEDVGENFAEEARRIHYREAPERGIRGVATREQKEALDEEGIETLQIPLLGTPKPPLH